MKSASGRDRGRLLRLSLCLSGLLPATVPAPALPAAPPALRPAAAERVLAAMGTTLSIRIEGT
ncbi:MAG TPA: hypothetical protein VIZ69_01580, partial [Thermoanaerobaculia bacterium]